MHHFDNILNRKNNGSMKWNQKYIEKRFHIQDIEDIYPLFIADMDFHMDETIKQKIQEQIDQADFGYFTIQDSFYQSIIHWYHHIHHIELKKEWIVPSIGTITTLNLLCDMLARDQDIVIMPPVYGPFQNCSQVGHTLTLPLLLKEMRYYIDFINLEKLFMSHHVKVLMLCHPHNPGGIMWSKEELQQLISLCRQYQVTILVDEIHSDIQLTNNSFTSMIELASESDNIIVSTSPNKTFNISSLTTSYILCKNQNLIQQFQYYLQHLHISCNRMGIQMIEYVYTYGESWYKDVLSYIQSNMNDTISTLQDVGMKVMIPDCGFLILVYLPYIEDVDSFVLNLAQDTHVLVETGSRFISHYDGWIRINVATSYPLLKEAIQRLSQYYKQYTKKVNTQR